MADCYPWWHFEYLPMYQLDRKLTNEGKRTHFLTSGCKVDAYGNVPCKPETMRAGAEQQLRARGYTRPLTLAEYTLARYMQGEVGNGTIMERVAVGEAAVNRARRRKTDVNGLLLYTAKEANRGWYGPIHGPGGVDTAPYGRWATTSQDPTVLTTLLAQLVLDGRSNNFNRNADDQDGPEAWVASRQKKGQSQAEIQAALNNYIARLDSEGKYWVGPIPGIDHWHTFLQYTPNAIERAAMRSMLVDRARKALTLPIRRPVWGDLPQCSRTNMSSIITIVLSLGLGAWLFKRYQTRKLAEPR